MAALYTREVRMSLAPAGSQSMTAQLCAVSTGMERAGEVRRRARAVTLPRW